MSPFLDISVHEQPERNADLWVREGRLKSDSRLLSVLPCEEGWDGPRTSGGDSGSSAAQLRLEGQRGQLDSA